jgi:PKD repeat protein
LTERNPLKYTWAFGDGSRAENVSTAWTAHNYSAASFNLTVALTVYDVAGLSASKTFYIKTDGIVPIPDFTVRNHTVASPMYVNQNEALVFNGAGSVDHIASTADVGVIKTWAYIWGDGNVTTIGVGENQNVTKTYARAGTFTMMLNVTDAAGHVSTKSLQVVVRDKTPPVVSFLIQRNGTNVVTALENQTLVLTANATYDVNDTFASLNFTWSFGDGQTGYGPWLTHSFGAIKTFSVKLSVTDLAGNVANQTKSLTITSASRPDLRVVSMVFADDIHRGRQRSDWSRQQRR